LQSASSAARFLAAPLALKIVAELGVEKVIGPAETMLIGAAAASLVAWWALGFVMRSLGPGGPGWKFWHEEGKDADGR